MSISCIFFDMHYCLFTFCSFFNDFYFFFFKQKTAYEMRISDWSSDVCSSDLMFNTSSDIVRFKLSEVVGDDAVPTPMFSFLQEGALTINNGDRKSVV